MLACMPDIYGPISFKLGMMIKISKLYILISVWMTSTFITNCVRNKKNNNFGAHFLTNLSIYVDEIQYCK